MRGKWIVVPVLSMAIHAMAGAPATISGKEVLDGGVAPGVAGCYEHFQGNDCTGQRAGFTRDYCPGGHPDVSVVLMEFQAGPTCGNYALETHKEVNCIDWCVGLGQGFTYGICAHADISCAGESTHSAYCKCNRENNEPIPTKTPIVVETPDSW